MTTPDRSTLPAVPPAHRVAARHGLLRPASDRPAGTSSFTPADLKRADEELLHVDVRAC